MESQPKGSLLKTLRRERGLSQAELADLAGLSVSSISAFESDTRPPSVTTGRALVEALGKQAKLTSPQAQELAEWAGFTLQGVDPDILRAVSGLLSNNPEARRELHRLLDKVLDASDRMPDQQARGIIAGLRAYLITMSDVDFTPESIEAPASRLAKHSPPEVVGDREVTVIEPVDPGEPDDAQRRRHG